MLPDEERDATEDELEIADLRRQLHRADLEIARLKGSPRPPIDAEDRVSYVAKNHPQQVGRRGANDLIDDRATPWELFDPLHAEFGFTIDAAAGVKGEFYPCKPAIFDATYEPAATTEPGAEP